MNEKKKNGIGIPAILIVIAVIGAIIAGMATPAISVNQTSTNHSDENMYVDENATNAMSGYNSSTAEEENETNVSDSESQSNQSEPVTPVRSSESVKAETAEGTHVYDFSTGAGTDKWAYEGGVDGRSPTTVNEPSDSIHSYSAISADDGTYESYVTTSDGTYAAQRFIFHIDEDPANISAIYITWNGKGWHDFGGTYNGTYLYIWNGTAYEELANNDVGTETTLTGGVTSGISNYINANNVTVLVEQRSAQELEAEAASHIETDYIKLEVVTTSASDHVLATLGLVSVKQVKLSSSSSPTTIYVNTTGWWRPGGAFNESSNPIQDAIFNASAGDVIFVYNGTYYVSGGLAVDKTLTLSGEGADNVTLDFMGGEKGLRIGVDADGSIVPAPGSVVDGFRVVNASTGIAVYEKAPNCIVRNNVVEGVPAPITTFASNTTIKGNIFDGASEYIQFGKELEHIRFIDNVVSNSTKTYASTKFYAANSVIVNNTFINNVAGLGLYSDKATNITVARNNLISSGAGIKLYDAPSGNKIYLNNFVNNTKNVVIGGSGTPINFWNSTEPIEYICPTDGKTYTGYLGNYWSDHPGGAEDGCGIWATPYGIPPDSPIDYDYHPLMAPFENYLGEAAEEKPDLLVTAINAYHNNTGCPAWFNLSNEIDVTVKNNGTGAAEASNVSLYIDGEFFGKLRVPPLDAGESATVTFRNWKPIGEDCLNPPCDFNWSYKEYNFTAVADCDGEVEESNETNNEMSVKDKACYNGYMADEPLENVAHGMLNGHLIFTTGDGVYASLYSVGDVQTTHYNINLPDGATTKLALLYVYYTWCKPASGVEYACPEMEVNITTPAGTTYTLPLERAYNDTKCTCPYAYYNYPWGTYVYNVTEYITEDGTYTVTVKNVCTQCSYFCVAAPGLLILYEDTNAPLIEYWINEGADLLMGGRRYTTSSNLAWWECINNATFPASSETSEVANVTLGVVAPWGGEAWGEYTSYLFFNGIKLGTGVYQGYNNQYDETIDSITMHIGSTNAQVGVNVTDVTAYYMNGSDNVVGQADDGDNMMPAGAFLVVTYKIPTPPKPFVIYGWVNYSNGTAVLNPNVTITNLNTSEVFTATTSPDSNYYQVSTTSCNISAGDVLHFRVSDTNTTEFNHTVTQDEIDNGGFMQNITIIVAPVGLCGDVDCDGEVTMSDGRQIYMNIIYGADKYPLNNTWAADVDCDGEVTMSDGRQIYMNIIYGADKYPLNCCQ